MGAAGGRGSSNQQGVCCGTRGSFLATCRNDRLTAYLEQLAKQEKAFESAWLYREDLNIKALQEPLHQYILLYQRSELVQPSSNPTEEGTPRNTPRAVPARIRRQLRLDWGRDGLSFMELDQRLPEEMLVRSKVMEPALKAADLLRHLEALRAKTFDADGWNSSSFCFHLINGAPGKEYQYR